MSAGIIVAWALAKLFGSKLLIVIGVAGAARWTGTTYGRERVFWWIVTLFDIVTVTLLWGSQAIDAGALLRAIP